MNIPDSEQAVEPVQSPPGLFESIRLRVERYPFRLVFFLLVITALPFVFVIDAPIHGDVELYRSVGENLSQGVMPYRDRALEYPPYAIPIFLLPWLMSHDSKDYQIAFGLLVVLMDSLIKSLLLWEGFRRNKGVSGFLPLILYCVTVPFIRYFYLQRYDIFPAVLTLASVICFARTRFAWAGVILGIAAGVKVYPAFLVPVLWALAVRQKHGLRFGIGVIAASVPFLALSFFLPWWRFMSFHGERGLQVESLYAAILWLARLLGFAEVQWTQVKAWTEVTGPVAQSLTPVAKFLMITMTLGSVGFATWVAARVSKLELHQLARLVLIPVLAFIAFNIVLSPQYLIWLLPLAALGLLGGEKWPMFLIAASVMVTPVIYPGRHYGSGLDLTETLVLLVRNIGLVVVWGTLLNEFWQSKRRPVA